MKQYIILFKNSNLEFTRQLFGQVHLHLDEEEKEKQGKKLEVFTKETLSTVRHVGRASPL